MGCQSSTIAAIFASSKVYFENRTNGESKQESCNNTEFTQTSTLGEKNSTRHSEQEKKVKIVIAFVGSEFDESSNKFTIPFKQCQKIKYEVKFFQDADDFFKYSKDQGTEIIMIASASMTTEIIDKIDGMSILKSVYILTPKNHSHTTWDNKSSKIKGIYNDIGTVSKTILVASRSNVSPSVSISYNKLDPMFLYTQLLKETVINMNDNQRNSLNEFRDYCSTLGDIDRNELNEFVNNYSAYTPIWWYTKDSFLYRMVNRGFHRMDVGIIQATAFFIRDLHNQIEQIYQTNHANDRGVLRVFRGQALPIAAFEKMQQAKGDLMSFNNFLSTTKNRCVALKFAYQEASNSVSVGILFEITIDLVVLKRAKISFTPVSDFSYFGDHEQEILFTTHTIFRINSVHILDHYKTKRVYQVQLSFAENEDNQFQQLSESIRKNIEQRTAGWCRFGYVLLKLNESKKAIFIFEKIFQDASTDEEKYEAAYHLGNAYWKAGDYDKSLHYYNQAVDMEKRVASENYYTLAACYVGIGNVYCETGDYSKALEYYEKSLDMKTKSLPENDTEIAASYNNIGEVYRRMSKYKTALEYFKQSLEIDKKVLPENHPNLSASYTNIGITYKSMGEYQSALTHLEKAVDVNKKSLPDYHPDLVASYENMGTVLLVMRRYTEALEILEKSLSIKKIYLASDHLELATSYMHIGNLLHSVRNYTKALEYHEKALEIKKKSLPENHTSIATSYNNIGSLYKSKGDTEKALEYYRTSLGIKKRSLTENHESVATSYCNIGLLLNDIGEYSESLEHLNKALDIFEKTLEADHPHIQKVRKHIKDIKMNNEMIVTTIT